MAGEPDEPNPGQAAYDNFVRLLGRHVVCLSVIVQDLGAHGRSSGPERVVPFSAFVLYLGGQWLLATAGHCLESLDRAVSSRELLVVGSFIADSIGAGATSPHPTPISYADTPKVFIDDGELGVDLAVIFLRPLYRLGLASNGVVPLSESNWIGLDNPAFRDFALFGFPAEFHVQSGPVRGPAGPSASVGFRPVLLPVERTEVSDGPPGPGRQRRFVGRVELSRFGVESVAGMSGGPIFGLAADPGGGTRYGVIALQSTWVSRTRIVYGCPMESVAALLADCLA